MPEEDLDSIWERFKGQNDLESRNQLIEAYLPLVKRCAERMYFNLAQKVDIDDLYSAGLLGLIDAIGRYVPSRKIKFETFSSQRIRGAMLDDVRSRDWVPRLARSSYQKYQSAWNSLVQELGRNPSDDELIEKMQVDEKEFHRICMESNLLSIIPMEELSHSEEEGDSPESWLPDPKGSEKQKVLDRREFLQKIIEELPERKRNILIMYYFEEMTLKEIALTLGVTEGRISQILSSVLAQLKQLYSGESQLYL